MEKFKPNYLKCYDYDLTVNILAKYIKEYMDSLSDDIDKLFTMNILMFYYNIFVYEDDCDNYISYNELLESEILDTYDDGHTILTLLLGSLNTIREEDTKVLLSMINGYSNIANYIINQNDVIKCLTDFMNFIAIKNNIDCDFKKYTPSSKRVRYITYYMGVRN